MAARARVVRLFALYRQARMSFDADLTACAALVEKGDPDRFAAAMANPVAARRVLFPIYAFNVEVSRAPWVTQEPMIAEMRLQWWRDALEEIAGTTAPRRHEVVTPLSGVISADQTAVLDRLVAARRWDIYKDAFEDEAHFDRYIDETAGGLMWVAAQALGAQVAHEASLRKLGQAVGLARFLRAVPELEAQGRIPLVDGRAEAIAQKAQAVLDQTDFDKVRRSLPKAVRPAVTEAFLARDILQQAAQSPGRVAGGDLFVTPLRRSFRLWQWS